MALDVCVNERGSEYVAKSDPIFLDGVARR